MVFHMWIFFVTFLFYFFQYKLTVPKVGYISDLCTSLSALSGVPAEKVWTFQGQDKRHVCLFKLVQCRPFSDPLPNHIIIIIIFFIDVPEIEHEKASLALNELRACHIKTRALFPLSHCREKTFNLLKCP